MGFKNRLFNFMYGRYGYDKFSFFLLILSIILTIVQAFIPNLIVASIINLITFLIMFFVLFRCFSRNRAKRYAENQKFMKLFSPIEKFFKLTFNRIKYRKTHRYRKCPHCKKVLKLPAVKGKHRAACPCCGESFDVKI